MKQIKYMDEENFKKFGEILDKLSESSKQIAAAQQDFNNSMRTVYQLFHEAEKLFEGQQIED